MLRSLPFRLTIRRCSPLAGLALALAWAGACYAGHPLVTEDAGVIAEGQCELELVPSRLSLADAAPARSIEHGLSLQVGCAVGETAQLALRAGRVHGPDAHLHSVELNGKWRLASWGEAERPAQFTLAWGLTGERATSGGAWRHTGDALNAVLSQPLQGVLGSFTLHANLGHAHEAVGRRRTTTVALALEHEGLGPDQRLQPMAEIFLDDRDHNAYLNAGLRYAVVPERCYVAASWGGQLSGPRGRLATVGLKWVF